MEGGTSHHHLVHRFRKLSGKGDESGPMSFPFLPFPLVVGAGLWVHPSLRQRQLEECLFQRSTVPPSASGVNGALP